ncbi:proline-rich protein 1-like [Typha angustifolia]|uniref:proline-rich protein 1-like n=1 Tax=Typha angustifolia TaxID=59011 RepID=UPI003C2D06F0
MGRCLILAAIAALVVSFHGVVVEGWSSYGVQAIHVGGTVMCQDCSKDWNEWAHGETPIKGSKVAVTCMDSRNRVVYYTSDLTDDQGVFDLAVEKYVNGEELKPEGCAVRLVSSGSDTCNVMTNSGGGQSGVALYRPSQVDPVMVRYTVGPFYFTTPTCDLPK